jgi:hypothetical protein
VRSEESRLCAERSKYSHQCAKDHHETGHGQPDQRPGVLAALVERAAEGDRGGRHRLAQHDQREQAVPLGDVVPVVGGVGAAGARSAQIGTTSLQHHQQRKIGRNDQDSGMASRSSQSAWTTGHADRVAQRGGAAAAGRTSRRAATG